MHNRTGPAVQSFEMRGRDGLVIAPLVVAIVAFALYPQQAIEHGERAVRTAVRPALQAGSAEAAAAQTASTARGATP
jgi:NADH-quinone oxidoreductase subunit M